VVKQLSWLQIAALVAATLLNLVTFAPPWMIALPGLGFRRAFVLTQASTASTYIAPGGAAVGVGLAFAILRSWRFSAGSVGLATALTGIWNQLALLGFPRRGARAADPQTGAERAPAERGADRSGRLRGRDRRLHGRAGDAEAGAFHRAGDDSPGQLGPRDLQARTSRLDGGFIRPFPQQSRSACFATAGSP
jgi:hypothetical protein